MQWIIDQTHLCKVWRRHSLQQKYNYYIITLFMRNSRTSFVFIFISTFNDDLHKRFVSNSSSVESYLIHYLPNPQIMLHMCTFPHAACSCRDYCSAANQYCHCVGSRRSNVGNVMITEIHSNAIRSTFWLLCDPKYHYIHRSHSFLCLFYALPSRWIKIESVKGNGNCKDR